MALVITEVEDGQVAIGDTLVTLKQVKGKRVKLVIEADEEVRVRRTKVIERHLTDAGFARVTSTGNAWMKGGVAYTTREALACA